jgi:uncharacterized membrane protein
MSPAAITVATAITLFLCSMVAGFLVAFALVVMPGLRTLDDASYLRAFQVVDRVIQDNQPLFMLLWVGSIVAMLVALSLGFGSLEGTNRMLLLGAGALYLGGVQLPTVTVNVPLNDRVQTLDVDRLDAGALRESRAGFEPRWNRWNVIRTGLATVSVGLLILLLTRMPAPGPGTSELGGGGRDLVADTVLASDRSR